MLAGAVGGGLIFGGHARLAGFLTLCIRARGRRRGHALRHRRGVDAQRGLHGFSVRHRAAEIRAVALRLTLLLRLRAHRGGNGINTMRHEAIMPHRV